MTIDVAYKQPGRVFCLFIFVLLFSQSACSLFHPAISPADEQTAAITVLVKSALIKARNVDAAAIAVSENESKHIVLDGFVGSEQERQAALDSTRQSLPRRTIVDRLSVR